jgi:hypothetical protein
MAAFDWLSSMWRSREAFLWIKRDPPANSVRGAENVNLREQQDSKQSFWSYSDYWHHIETFLRHSTLVHFYILWTSLACKHRLKISHEASLLLEDDISTASHELFKPLNEVSPASAQLEAFSLSQKSMDKIDNYFNGWDIRHQRS